MHARLKGTEPSAEDVGVAAQLKAVGRSGAAIGSHPMVFRFLEAIELANDAQGDVVDDAAVAPGDSPAVGRAAGVASGVAALQLAGGIEVIEPPAKTWSPELQSMCRLALPLAVAPPVPLFWRTAISETGVRLPASARSRGWSGCATARRTVSRKPSLKRIRTSTPWLLRIGVTQGDANRTVRCGAAA